MAPLPLHYQRGLLLLYFLRLLKTKFSEFAEGHTECLFEIPLKTALVASPNEFYDLADCQAGVFGQFNRVLHLEPFGESLRSRFQVASEEGAQMNWREANPLCQSIG
jgi:hypothetical protein